MITRVKNRGNHIFVQQSMRSKVYFSSMCAIPNVSPFVEGAITLLSLKLSYLHSVSSYPEEGSSRSLRNFSTYLSTRLQNKSTCIAVAERSSDNILYTGRFIMYSGITKIYYRKPVGHVFTKPVQIEGTQNFFFPGKLFFIAVHISAARGCECM